MAYGNVLAAAILAAGLAVAGWLAGEGLTRSKLADRAVTVRGLAERDVVADTATWTIAYAATANQLGFAQAKIDQDTRAILAFLKAAGFPDAEVSVAGVSVNQYVDNNPNLPDDRRLNVTIRQRLQLKTGKVMEARRAFARSAALIRQGVALDSDSGGIVYSFTRLGEVKPAMTAAATKDARAVAEQFARDSGASVGGIRQASQGYFSIEPRAGDTGEAAQSPFQKVRVVTTIDYYLR
jgi:hypothetical protein